MRFQSIALGKGTSDEMFLMVTEKLDAMAEARAIILRGGDPSIIIVGRLSRRRPLACRL